MRALSLQALDERSHQLSPRHEVLDQHVFVVGVRATTHVAAGFVALAAVDTVTVDAPASTETM